MNNTDPKPARFLEKRLVIALAAALSLFAWWLLSDREPTQKEMTFAYRKYVVNSNDDLVSQELAVLRNHLHVLELIKQQCKKLSERSYRCEATVLMDGNPIEGLPPSRGAIYSRDAKGWRFQAIAGE